MRGLGLGPEENRMAAEATVVATAALTGLTVAVAVGMGRLFAGGDHLVPLLAAALVGHGAMWTGRRLGAPISVSAGVAIAAVGLAGVWLLLPESTAYGIPGPGTLTAVRGALSDAWSQFGDVVAPTPPTDGFLLAAMAGVGIAAVLADWAAFRMRVLFEAVVPSFTLFVFTATLGDEARRSFMVALYLVALLLFLVIHRAGLESEGSSWFASRSRGGAGTLVQGAAALVGVAVVAAVVLGPRLPGASADAVLAWRDSDRSGGSGRRTTVSPLVDIRGRLLDQSTTEVFSVRSTTRAYWRLTSLDTFDGRIWSSDASYQQIGERVPAGKDTRSPARTVRQDFTIRALASIWLPAAYRPVRVAGIDDVSYNPDLGSLITGQDTTDGFTYHVDSAVPSPTGDELGGAGAPLPDAERFTRLPPVSRPVAELARSITRTGATPYEQALALQNYFRRGFVYDLNAPAGHDERALEFFLFRSRRGYCEQFAGAYAVLARSVGLSTRVAVGFTPGELGGDGEYHVRGLNAHAWPEVFVAGAGWVAFEPTPGRGAPGAEGYTGVPEAQAVPQDPSTATTAQPSTTVAPDDTATPSTTAAPDAPESDGGAGRDHRPLWRNPVVAVVLAAAGLGLAACIAVPAAKASRRRRRRARAATPADRVWVAWTEATDAVARAGAPRRAAETLHEHAARAGTAAVLPSTAATALATLARDASAASYGVGAMPDEVAARATAHAGEVESAVNAMATRRRRVAWLLDPRPLLPERRPDPPSIAPRRRRAADRGARR
ncbi:MAG TPA: transglutaminaseTgpA domain-containing protein [Acidimicrobiales bacterium]|nr:transglutaminaseTgpA domain-containing protein [Acidimicrobiales bacterium]